jgi:hypothetical protein
LGCDFGVVLADGWLGHEAEQCGRRRRAAQMSRWRSSMRARTTSKLRSARCR